MELKWTRKALSDLARLYEFLALVNKPAAARTVQALTAARTSLLANPRIGEQLDEFQPREVRRILVGHYEMRYEIQDSTIYMLRLWHTREDRRYGLRKFGI
jgi:plasmid stabilization system protein ParE